MSNYANTKATIAANVYTNHANQVTAEMVKTAFNSVVDTLIAGGYLYKGVAHPGDAAETPDANVFYLATEVGTYTNKGGLQVADGEVAVLKYNGSWTKEVTGAATAAQISELGQKIDDLALGKFYGFFPADTDLPAGDEPGYAYVGASSPFAIYVFNNGAWSDSGSVYGPAEGNGEDIDTNAQGKLQFANRPTTYGMGYKILRRDATFASQVGDSDTIYEIRYDFDLGGASVTIPAGCVLKFVGGSLSNGDVDLNGAQIDGVGIKCSITNPFGGCVNLSMCLIDDEQSTPDYNADMLQMLVDNGIGIQADVDEVTCDKRITCKGGLHFYIVGVNGKKTAFNFPDSDGFVFVTATEGGHTGVSAGNRIDGISVNSSGICFNFKPSDYIGAVFTSVFSNIRATSQNDSCFYVGDNSGSYSTLCFDVAFRDIIVTSYNGYGFDGFAGNNPEFTRINIWGCQLAAFHDCIGTFRNIIFDQFPATITGRTGWIFDFGFSLGHLEIINSHLEAIKEVILTRNANCAIPVSLINNYINHLDTWNEDGVAKYNKFTFGGLWKGFYLRGNTFQGEQSLSYGTGFGEFKTINSTIPKVNSDRAMNIIASTPGYTYSFAAPSNTTENLTQAEYNKVAYEKIPRISSDRVVSAFSFVKATQITPANSINLTTTMGQFFKLKSTSDTAGTDTISGVEGNWFSTSHNVNWYVFYNANTTRLVQFNNASGNSKFLTWNGKPLILNPGEFVIGWIETSSQKMVLGQKFDFQFAGGATGNRPSTLGANDLGRVYLNDTTKSPDMWNGTEWTDACGDSLKTSGTTAERPTTAIRPGFCYFDETIGKPIWRSNSGWVDATGASV